jgi:rare lipoprotein A
MKLKSIIKFKYLLFLSLLIFLSSCSSTKTYNEYENVYGKFIEHGVASWYGPNFHGKKTANGERYDMYGLTAAHKTLPFNSILRVVNKRNNESVIVRINDRGPFVKNRIIDLSRKAAEKIDMIRDGATEVELFLLSEEKLPSNIKKESYTVQVASYFSYDDAKNFSTKIFNSFIKEAIVDDKKYFRVYSGIFESANEANKHLDYLENLGFEGFVKQIEN